MLDGLARQFNDFLSRIDFTSEYFILFVSLLIFIVLLFYFLSFIGGDF